MLNTNTYMVEIQVKSGRYAMVYVSQNIIEVQPDGKFFVYGTGADKEFIGVVVAEYTGKGELVKIHA